MGPSSRRHSVAWPAGIADGVFSVDRDWSDTYVNRACGLPVGRDAAKLVATNTWEEFAEAVGTLFERGYRTALESQQMVAFEEYLTEPRGDAAGGGRRELVLRLPR